MCKNKIKENIMETLNFKEKINKKEMWRIIYGQIITNNGKYNIQSIKYRYLLAKAKELLKDIKYINF